MFFPPRCSRYCHCSHFVFDCASARSVNDRTRLLCLVFFPFFLPESARGPRHLVTRPGPLPTHSSQSVLSSEGMGTALSRTQWGITPNQRGHHVLLTPTHLRSVESLDRHLRISGREYPDGFPESGGTPALRNEDRLGWNSQIYKNALFANWAVGQGRTGGTLITHFDQYMACGDPLTSQIPSHGSMAIPIPPEHPTSRRTCAQIPYPVFGARPCGPLGQL